jgi:hypothetical protein
MMVSQIVFSSVPVEADRQTQQLRGVLDRLGATPCTAFTILSDGADGPRSLGEAASVGPTSHVLDWFHLAMRIQHVAQAVKGWPEITNEDRQECARSPMLWNTSAGACGTARCSGHLI